MGALDWIRSNPRTTGLGAAAMLALAVLIGVAVHDRQMDARLLETDADLLPSKPDLVHYAEGLAKPAFRSHCASCHGADMKGEQAKGAPNLTDRIWLYDDGGVADIERTILYGIRSGDGKARNITDMPALGRTFQLDDTEVRDAATYVLSLTRPEADTGAVQRGSAIFQGKGSCYDCHSTDASGNPDYGAPAFTDSDWLYGGDFETVYKSVYSGRHGVCPAWFAKLKPAVIRALALYIHEVSMGPKAQGGAAHG